MFLSLNIPDDAEGYTLNDAFWKSEVLSRHFLHRTSQRSYHAFWLETNIKNIVFSFPTEAWKVFITCSKWIAQALSFWTNIRNFCATSGSGSSSESMVLGHPRKTCKKVLRRNSREISSWPSTVCNNWNLDLIHVIQVLKKLISFRIQKRLMYPYWIERLLN